MPDAMGTSREVQSHNRKIRYRARREVEDRLTAKYGGGPTARLRARKFMEGKHVHKTESGRLVLTSPAEHGGKHGRGNRGKPRAYRRS
jgi:hypothetical protein